MGPRLRIKVEGRKAISNLKSPRMFPTPQQGGRRWPRRPIPLVINLPKFT